MFRYILSFLSTWIFSYIRKIYLWDVTRKSVSLSHWWLYTNYEFIPFYWRPYIQWVINEFEDTLYKNSDIDNITDKLVITKINGSLVGLSQITDYNFRYTIYEHVNLYNWNRFTKKTMHQKHQETKKKRTWYWPTDPQGLLRIPKDS